MDDLQIPCSGGSLLPRPPVTDWQRQGNFAGEGGLAGGKWETFFKHHRVNRELGRGSETWCSVFQLTSASLCQARAGHRPPRVQGSNAAPEATSFQSLSPDLNVA